MTDKRKDMLRHADLAAFLCIAACVIFFILRASYSFGYDDESWYISSTHRLVLGDSLIRDEWNVAQFMGFFLYIPVKLFLYFKGSTEGISLFFRYVFIFFQTAVSVFAYWRLRKRYGYFSVAAVILFFLHASWGILALYYNTMGVAFVLIVGLIFATSEKFSKPAFFFAGICFAGAVLCNPPLALVYFLFSIFIFCRSLIKKIRASGSSPANDILSLKCWLWLTLGISFLALLLITFIFTRISFKEFLDCLPYYFIDPEYDFRSFSELFQTIQSTKFFIHLSKPLFWLAIVLLAIIARDKKRINRRPIYFSLSLIIFFAYVFTTLTSEDLFIYIKAWMFPLLLPGLVAYILSEKKDKRVFVFLWLFGLVFASSLEFASALGEQGAAVAFAVSDVAGVLFIGNVLNEMKQQAKDSRGQASQKSFKTMVTVVSVLTAAALIAQAGQQIFVMTNLKVISDEACNPASVKNGVIYDTVLQTGPQKGLKTTSYKAKIYNGIISDLEKIKSGPDGPVLITENFSWFYLYLEQPYAIYSTWFYSRDIGGFVVRIKEYYNLNKDKVPMYVYIPKYIGHTWEPEEELYIKPGKEIRSAEILKEVEKILDEHNRSYTAEHSDFGITLYVRKKT